MMNQRWMGALALGAAVLLAAESSRAQEALRIHAPLYASAGKKDDHFKPFKANKKDVVRVTVRIYQDATGSGWLWDAHGLPWAEVLEFRTGQEASDPAAGQYVVPVPLDGEADLVLGASVPLPAAIGLYPEVAFTTQVERLHPKSGEVLKSYAESPAQPLGQAGPVGPHGPPGPKGDKGAVGDSGAIGPKGLEGDTGDKGAKGAQGDKGAKGDTGAKGAKGEVGDPGPAGPGDPQTAVVEKPVVSKSAYQVTKTWKLLREATITKQRDDSKLEVHLASRILAKGWHGDNLSAMSLGFQFRIDGVPADGGSIPRVYESDPSPVHVPMYAYFEGVQAGQHELSVWVRGHANQPLIDEVRMVADTGTDDHQSFLVKEVR
jgi:hypothetical protein